MSLIFCIGLMQRHVCTFDLLFTFASLSFADTPEKRLFRIQIPITQEDWFSWSTCSASCGNTGERHRTRGCHTILGVVHWTNCGTGGEGKEACVGICPQTTGATMALLGTWSPWGSFSPCDKTCGGGIQIRHRTCGSHSGPCIGDSLESASCNAHQCPVQSTLTVSTTQPVTTTGTPDTEGIGHHNDISNHCTQDVHNDTIK